MSFRKLFTRSARASAQWAGLAVISSSFLACPIGDGAGGSIGTESLLRRALFKEQQSSDNASMREARTSSQAHYYYLLGEVALSKERPEEAIEFFAKAAELETAAAPTLRMQLVRLYLQEKQLEEALEQLQIVLAEDPDYIEALQLQAGVQATLGREEEAIKSYRKLIDLKGAKSEEPYIFAASLHLQSSQFDEARTLLEELLSVHSRSFFGNYYLARIAEAQSQFAAAEKYYLRALELSPRADAVRIELARLMGAQKRFDEGIAMIDEILARDKDNVEAKTIKGQLLVGQNRLEKAIDEFEEVSTLEEDSSNTRFRIGLIKLQRRNVSAAITDFNLVLAADPDNTAARYYLASAYASLGRVSEAISQVKRIDDEQEYFVESRTLGAFLLQREERFAEAIELVEEVLAKQEDTKLLGFLANLHKESDELDKAIEVMQRIVAVESDSDQHYFTLGVYQDEAGQWRDAVTSMKKALELNPRNANVLNYLGYTYADKGVELDEAEQLIRRALEIEPENGYYIDSLGWVLYRKKEYDAAREQLEKAVALVPNDAVILEHLARIYKAIGQVELARNVAQKALEFAPESEDKAVLGRLQEFLTTLP